MNKFNYNDGGRANAGYKGKTGDCVCRSIAIVTGLPYQQVYDYLSDGNFNQTLSKRQKVKRSKSASGGINVKRKWFNDYMKSLGFEWVSVMGIGTGCTTHLKSDELPSGKIICVLSGHYTSVIDGVINDTYDPSRNGTRCVYAYWKYNN